MGSTRAKGTLKKWLDDKGFGFITPEKGSKEIFVHISSFDRNIPRRPVIGDTVYYHITTDKKGKTKAVDAAIEGAAPVNTTKATKLKPHYKHKKRSDWKLTLVCLIVLLAGGSMLVKRFQSSSGGFSKLTSYTTRKDTPSSNFTCEGKTHCSEMKSCDEAKFYIKNCPGTKMDGDNDGIPCERQWCK